MKYVRFWFFIPKVVSNGTIDIPGWFRQWLVAEHSSNHCPKQRGSSLLTHTCIIRPQRVNQNHIGSVCWCLDIRSPVSLGQNIMRYIDNKKQGTGLQICRYRWHQRCLERYRIVDDYNARGRHLRHGKTTVSHKTPCNAIMQSRLRHSPMAPQSSCADNRSYKNQRKVLWFSARLQQENNISAND